MKNLRILWGLGSMLGLLSGACVQVNELDSDNPDLGVCPPDRPHLVVGFSGSRPGIDRYVVEPGGAAIECLGAALPDVYEEWTVTAVGALHDGSDLVAITEFYGGGPSRILRYADNEVVEQVDVDGRWAVQISEIPFGGERAFAVMWGEGTLDSPTDERVEVYSYESGIDSQGSWEVSSLTEDLAGTLDGDPRALSIVDQSGVHQLVAPSVGERWSDTDQPSLGRPESTGSPRYLASRGDEVRAASYTGIFAWSRGNGPGLVGPMECRAPLVSANRIPNRVQIQDLVVEENGWSLILSSGDVPAATGRFHLCHVGQRGECDCVESFEELPVGMALGQ